MSDTFRHNDLRFYVRFLWEQLQADVRFMVPGFDDVIQATPETIEAMLQSEDEKNARHMETYWLHFDKAMAAVSMRQSDGYSGAKDIEHFYSERKDMVSKGKSPSKAYIGLARLNAERSKGHLKNVPADFAAKANFPSKDNEAIAGLNYYRDEILNANHWQAEKDHFIDDLHDFGSGIMYNPYQLSNNDTDLTFFEERIEQGQPLEWDEYQQMQSLTHQHKMMRLDTFEVIRDRRARGINGMDFDNDSHTIVTWLEPIPIAKAMQEYPKYADRITKGGLSDLYRRINPQSGALDDDMVMTTRKHSWVKCPVSYMRDVKVHLGDGVYTTVQHPRQRDAILRFERMEGVGIVDVFLDEYAHKKIPLTMGQRRPSKMHAYGIGAYKDMWAPEWAYNIAFNGKFDWFNRSSKGVKYTFKGLIDEQQYKQAAKTPNGMVEIDPSKLNGKFKNVTDLNQLIKTEYPPNVPTVFSNFEATMEELVNRQSGWYSAAGKPAGSSGRQENILNNQSEIGQENPVRNLHAAFLRMGDKFFSNIIQFDGDKHIQFEHEDKTNGNTQHVELNKPVGEVPQQDPETGMWKLFAYEVKNSLKSLQFSTQITSRSIVPVNPTERRFFWQDLILNYQTLFTSEEGLITLEMMDEQVLGGILKPYLKKQAALFEKRAQSQQQQFAAEHAADEKQQQFDNAVKIAETIQNKYRLQKKATSDLMSALSKFSEGDMLPLQQFIANNPDALAA